MPKTKIPLIKTSNGYAYGGDQAWFADPKARKSGCGSVSAAHLIYTLTKNDAPSDISEDETVDQKSFEALMTDIYHFAGGGLGKKKPTGISTGRFVCSVLRYGLKNGLLLTPCVLITTYVQEAKAASFIRHSLDRGYVLALAMAINRAEIRFSDSQKPSTAVINYHYVTITDYDITSDNDMQLTVSTWGRKAQLSFRELYRSWQSPRAIDTALIYFKKEGSPASVRRQICLSYLLVLRTLLRVPVHIFTGQF